ncbi:T-cell antigen CD7 [Platysternon megacephalum]|uniref:T-cell antigen CD7 n=1 Tax=Platysternon megacephalum TaxID=55544 RepID=A0A4D9E143_9SAUR|nr:T-cell antigen CD7 [Platysternon megacephalum]
MRAKVGGARAAGAGRGLGLWRKKRMRRVIPFPKGYLPFDWNFKEELKFIVPFTEDLRVLYSINPWKGG